MSTELANWKSGSIKKRANIGLGYLEKGDKRIKEIEDMILELDISKRSKNKILEALRLTLVSNDNTKALFKDISEIIGD